MIDERFLRVIDHAKQKQKCTNYVKAILTHQIHVRCNLKIKFYEVFMALNLIGGYG